MGPEALIFAGKHLCDSCPSLDQLGHITALTLVVAGREDFVFPPECQLELIDGIPDAQLLLA